MLSARMMKLTHQESKFILARLFDRAFGKLESGYAWTIRAAADLGPRWAELGDAHDLKRLVLRLTVEGVMPMAEAVAARDDVLVPSLMSEQLAAAIPGSRLHVAPWGAHAGPAVYRPGPLQGHQRQPGP